MLQVKQYRSFLSLDSLCKVAATGMTSTQGDGTEREGKEKRGGGQGKGRKNERLVVVIDRVLLSKVR